MGLSQLAKQATRVLDIAGHTTNYLDILLTTDPDRCIVTVSSPLGTSDHCLVKSVTSFSPPDRDSRGERRVWRYKSADWDEMRYFFASYPWQQVCFSSENPSSCAEAISDVVRQAMEYYIPYSNVPIGCSARPWFNAACAEAEKRKHSAFLSWVDARDRKAPDLSSKKRAFKHAVKSYKKVQRKARFDRISHIGQKLSAQPSGSRALWSLARSVAANFCWPTLPPLVWPVGILAHTAREKAGLFASLFAYNSRLDTGSATPPTLPHCGTSMPEIRIRNRKVLRALCRLDVNKASRPDSISATVLKACAPESSANVPKSVPISRVVDGAAFRVAGTLLGPQPPAVVQRITVLRIPTQQQLVHHTRCTSQQNCSDPSSTVRLYQITRRLAWWQGLIW
ncbi:hypothetical protein PYW07_007216 [Mythimna separata]|uniref:Uncharacterized protein n=1 Tax=Mythimna separata TaxID=271217 RepID=A0AAD8E188_MYTSE|nr:hypothetical protein PYW07_007216 [Mythimna separata]